MVSQKVDILVLGPTGYTGKLVVQYLESHPQRRSFSLGIGGRSLQKLQLLSKELSLSSDISTFGFDVTNYAEVESVVQTAQVVINCIGPFFKWSTPIVRACALNGVHYVDITGEPWWIKDIIHDYDFEASKTKAIIIPACGNDSIPSDLTAYLSARALTRKGPNVTIGKSLTAVKMPDSGVSGGTLHTIISGLEDVPRNKMHGINVPHWLSPVHSAVDVPFQLTWNLPFTKIYGGISPMGAVNEKIVYRTWGLFEARALSTAHKDPERIRYGPKFSYDECMQTPSRLLGFLWSVTLMTSMVALTLLPPLRWFLKKFGPQPGSGPKHYDGAIMTYTNVTATDAPNPDYVQTTVTFKGAAYPMTAVLVVESALTLLFDHAKLTNMAKEGGVLTSMSALGDSLVKRLVGSGRVSYETKALHPGDTRKTA